LRARLLALPFDAFTTCVALLLEKMGYDEVRPAGRADWKGRNRHGGCDLTAAVRVGPYRRLVVAALKQFGTDLPVFNRTVDELRGVCLRAGASEALLVTTSSFSPSIRREVVQQAPVAPVRLLDGEALLDLLVRHRVGVCGDEGAGGMSIDATFFDALERNSRGNARAGRAGSSVSASRPEGGTAAVVVTVSVTRLVCPVSRSRPRSTHKRGHL
jgi:restriction endonuclease Mrr